MNAFDSGPVRAGGLATATSRSGKLVVRGQGEERKSAPRPHRSWIRGVFRREPDGPLKRGILGSLSFHVALGIAALLGAFGSISSTLLIGNPNAKPEEVLVEMPRVKPPVQTASLPIAPPGEEQAAEEPPPAPAKPPAGNAAPQAPARPSGEAGRAAARAALGGGLGEALGSVDRVMGSLASATPSDRRVAATPVAAPAIKGPRAAGEVSAAGSGPARGSADAAGTSLAGSGVAVDEIRGVTSSGGGTAGAAGASAVGGRRAGGRDARGGALLAGEARSNASLLAVVRRYAPGIQYCYENQLSEKPGLRGRMLVTLTVAASGAVSDVSILEDSLGSDALAACAISRIRAWRFPEIPTGTVTFQVPFVFTPPDGG